MDWNPIYRGGPTIRYGKVVVAQYVAAVRLSWLKNYPVDCPAEGRPGPSSPLE